MLAAMAKSRESRRLLGLVQRSAKAKAGASVLSKIDESVLWMLQESAIFRTREAKDASHRVSSKLAKHRESTDTLADCAHSVATRAQELKGGFARMVDTLERLSLVALNAGLEGARLGEGAGRSLLLVSEEVRAHVTRGNDGAREVTTTLGDLGTEVANMHATIEQARQASSEASHEAARVGTASTEAERVLGELGERLRKSAGHDPETSRLVAEASDQARALMGTLGALRGKVPQKLVLGALRPMLDPLARILADPERGKDKERE
jgi:methyl-accepting chemotaxis protein